MRKIFMAGMVLGMGFGIGCQDNKADEVRSEREDVMEQRQELSQTRTEEQQQLQQELAQQRQEHQQEVQDLRQQTQEEIASERGELAQERQDLQEARQERQEAMGGAGEAGANTLSGTIESKMADKLTIKTGEGSKELIVDTDTQFTHMGRDIRIAEVPQGAEIRASYSMEANKMVADEVEVLAPNQGSK